MIVNVLAVDAVAVAPGACVDANIRAFLGGKAIEHRVV